MLKELMKVMLTGRSMASKTRKSENIKHGNKGMPAELQRQQIIAAEQKRRRKMQRQQGWFDGDGA